MKKLTADQKAWIVGVLLVLSGLAAMILAAAGGLLVAAVCFIPLTAAHGALLVGLFRECWREPDLEWEVYACPEAGRNPLAITEVRYRRLASFGNYENEAVEMAARVYPGDDPDGVLAALKGRVEEKLKEAGVVAQKHEEIFDLDQQIADQRNTLRQATERAEKAKAFLKEHGIELFGDLPF